MLRVAILLRFMWAEEFRGLPSGGCSHHQPKSFYPSRFCEQKERTNPSETFPTSLVKSIKGSFFPLANPDYICYYAASHRIKGTLLGGLEGEIRCNFCLYCKMSLVKMKAMTVVSSCPEKTFI